MSIVTSQLDEVSPQADGRRWVRERHVDHLTRAHPRTYLAAAALDLDASLAAHAPLLAADLAEAEIAANLGRVIALGSEATISMVHATGAQARAAIRAAYRDATRHEAIMLGDFLAGQSDAVLQSLFGLSAGQVTSLRTNRLTPAVSAAAAIRLATGA